MKFLLSKPKKKSSSSDRPLTIEDLTGKTYAKFTRPGIEVDLKEYFSTEEGREAFRRVANSGPAMK